MIINTETLSEQSWNSHSLFDTESGLRYNLMWISPENYKTHCQVHLDVVSAAMPGSELTGGTRYYGEEAIDFWLKLVNITDAGDVILRRWIDVKADLAQEGIEPHLELSPAEHDAWPSIRR